MRLRGYGRLTWLAVAGVFLIFVGLLPVAMSQGSLTGGTYFSQGEEQQIIAITRLLDGNRKLADMCVPGMDAEEFRDYFNDWLQKHPGTLSRALLWAFTSSVLDKCERNETP